MGIAQESTFHPSLARPVRPLARSLQGLALITRPFSPPRLMPREKGANPWTDIEQAPASQGGTCVVFVGGLFSPFRDFLMLRLRRGM